MSDITIDVDGISAEVDESDYAEDADAVILSVREARAEVSDLTSLYDEPDWDYNTLTAAYGEDDESEVE